MNNTQTDQKRIEIDPDGDLILELDGANLQVSSKVLKLSSKVWKAMLSPNFAEGNQQLGDDKLLYVSLPEDDTEAMTAMCYLLHHRYRDVDSNPSFEFLAKLAVVVDKYDCTQAVSQWSGFSIHKILHGGGPNPYNDQMLPLTFIFDDALGFQQFTKTHVYSRSKIRLSKTSDIDPGSGIWSLLPDHLIDAINEKEQQTKRGLVESLEALIIPYLKKNVLNGKPTRGTQPDHGDSHNPNAFSECNSSRTDLYLAELTRLEIFPFTQACNKHTLDALVSKLTNPSFPPVASNYHSYSCTTCKWNMRTSVDMIKKEAQDAFSGLCLDCVKRRQPDKKDGKKCRMVHEGYLGI